ncbi:MAG: orotidine-5-phosphate decarboxylase [Planctomycetota bacterium]|jgi:orotidine-5'-phosphate decarboxylase
MQYSQRLNQRIQQTQTPALVGIDPRFDWLPEEFRQRAHAHPGGTRVSMAKAFLEFSFELLQLVAPFVPAVKPQAAFFEQLGLPGLAALHAVMSTARKLGLIVIADAKRGDIGSTAEAYADGWLAGTDPDAAAWPADALTINPWLGADSLQPFVDIAARRGAGLYVLVRTSNPGAAQLQDRIADHTPLYQTAAALVGQLNEPTRPGGNGWGCVGAVVGATWPTQLTELRAQIPGVPFLVPGYGAQGGSSADTAGAFAADGLGALVNSSRGINFAWRRKPFSEQFGETHWRDAVVAAVHEMIADLAANTPAGKLKTP